MVSDPFEDTVKGEHVIVTNPRIIPLDGREKMEVRAVAQFPDDPDGRKPFISDNDTVSDIIIQDKRTIRDRIDAVTGKYFRTDRLHGFDIVGVDNGFLI